MPEIQAFRGVRYNLGRVGSLSDVVTPPYDVIGPELQDHFYKLHPNSFIRIDLNKIEPGDDDEKNNRYTRAAKFYKQWRDEGVLDAPRPTRPSMSTTRSSPSPARPTSAAASCAISGSRGSARARSSRTRRPCRRPRSIGSCSPSPRRPNSARSSASIPIPKCEAQNLLDAAVAGKTPLVATDHLGVVHRLWPLTDVAVISKLSALMGPKPMFIADGHHRYETACNYKQQIYDSGFLSPTHPANFTLMMCVAMDDPGLIVMPTHRLFRSKGPAADGTPVELPPQQLALTSDQLTAKLKPCFTTRPAGQGPDAAASVWEDIETGGQQGAIGLYTQKDGRWLIATVTDAGMARMAEVAKEHSEAVARPGRQPAASAHGRRHPGLQAIAQAEVRPLDRGSDRRA